ncbi:MAG: phosphoglycerate kinase [Patescibacteria group bacterium]|nr:phosphoglycerate kinase [Patescibacteria group bacterium]
MKLLKDLDPKDKKIIVRLDFDVPVKNQKVIDGFRIDASLPTLKYLADAKKLYLIGHSGRPQGKLVESLRLKPQAKYLAKKLNLKFSERPCKFYERRYLLGEKIEILENLRFNDGEEINNQKFAQKLANLAEVFVFEAFAVSHRAHASVSGLAKILPTYLGLRCQKEIEILDKLRNEADQTVVLVGGAKIDDKSKIIKSYKAQKILFGGLTAAEVWLKKNEYKNEKFVLPTDGKMSDGAIKNYDDLSRDEILQIRDLGPKTIAAYKDIMKNLGKNIIYAGPMGQYEKKEFAQGTFQLFKAGVASGKKTIVLGGDSASAVQMFKLENQISYISVGGGAALNYLATGKMAF